VLLGLVEVVSAGGAEEGWNALAVTNPGGGGVADGVDGVCANTDGASMSNASRPASFNGLLEREQQMNMIPPVQAARYLGERLVHVGGYSTATPEPMTAADCERLAYPGLRR
jgi:hypothetical protein